MFNSLSSFSLKLSYEISWHDVLCSLLKKDANPFEFSASAGIQQIAAQAFRSKAAPPGLMPVVQV